MKTLLNLVWLTALVTVCLPAYAANPQSQLNGDQTLTVLVHDYAKLPDAAVHDLQTLTAVLLSRSGIRVGWVWCNTERRDARSALCDANLEPGRVVFRILAGYPGDRKRQVDPLGSAVIESSYASLYASQIRQSADRNGLSFGCLMAYAAVHEIGHLLLGTEHSRSGVMRGEWGKAEYRDMAQRSLGFSQTERQALRRAVPAPDLAGLK